MRPDLHEDAMRCIALAAGYSLEDANLIAWANRETDYSLQAHWYNIHKWKYYGTCFHFWPGDPKDLIVQVESELSRRIIDNVIAEEERIVSEILCNAGNRRKLDEYWLCAVGIALHGLLDRYSHQGWVGKFSKYNILPPWSKEKGIIPSLPFAYGHCPMGKIPDIANARWFDPRTNETIRNRDRVILALNATARVLGLKRCPSEIWDIFNEIDDYELRKEKLRDLAGVEDRPFAEVRKEMIAKYGREYKQAAAAQAKIVKEYMQCQ